MSEREKILVLDDSPYWLSKIDRMLGREYDLTLTQNNQEAIDVVKSGNYVLVILDWRLTEGVTGLDVLIKMREKVPDLRAIILTALDRSSPAMESVRAGALDYITKKGARLAERLKESIVRHKKTKGITIFLSYESTDREEVIDLHSRLTDWGFFPWIDRQDMTAGNWKLQIKKAINKSDFFIACLSDNFIQKRSYLNTEVKLALEKQAVLNEDDGYIIPGRLTNCAIPESLQDFHTIDLFVEGGFDELVRILLATKPK